MANKSFAHYWNHVGRERTIFHYFLILVVVLSIFLVAYFQFLFIEEVLNPIIEYDFDVCIISRVKNVAYLLPQWLEYHHLVGVDQFFIINDCSNDDGQVRSCNVPIHKFSFLVFNP